MPKLPTRRDSNRIPQHDYSKPGHYFITICTQNRIKIFGTLENNQMILNDAGIMVDSVFKEIPDHYPGMSIDQYIVMPNHVHGIITIANIVGAGPCAGPIHNNTISNNEYINGRTRGSAPTKLSLSNIIKRIKTLTTKKYIDGVKNHNWQPFDKRLWQRNYYDHIIRNGKSLNNIRNYIKTNPSTWDYDLENPDRIDNIELNEMVV